jgi:hypothetical protein
MTSEGGRGTLTIRDVKEADQGAYTCEAMNARGMVFGIPDGVLELVPQRGRLVGCEHQAWVEQSHLSVADYSPFLPPSRSLPRWALLPGAQRLLPALLLLWGDQCVPEQPPLLGPDPAAI